MKIKEFWRDVLAQNAEKLPGYFHKDAVIRWHCSNEQFTVSEYVRANCEYPGKWQGEIERVEEISGKIITAVRVYPVGGGASFHVVSFLTIEKDLITEMDEYWADDGAAPQWRRQMKIGRKIPRDYVRL